MNEKSEARVERGPVAQDAPFALGMAKLLEREGKTVAAAELRRLHAQRDALLEALRAAVADWDEEVNRGRWLDAARAAIKKAEEA